MAVACTAGIATPRGVRSTVVASLPNTMSRPTLPRLHLEHLPSTFPAEGAVRIELEEGVPVFRASTSVQARIEALLDAQQERALTTPEREELDCYEALEDHFSLLNRLARNLRQD